MMGDGISSLAGVDLNLLVPLHAMLEEGSVTRAARRVGISQPAMSHCPASLSCWPGTAGPRPCSGRSRPSDWSPSWWAGSRPAAGRSTGRPPEGRAASAELANHLARTALSLSAAFSPEVDPRAVRLVVGMVTCSAPLAPPARKRTHRSA